MQLRLRRLWCALCVLLLPAVAVTIFGINVLSVDLYRLLWAVGRVYASAHWEPFVIQYGAVFVPQRRNLSFPPVLRGLVRNNSALEAGYFTFLEAQLTVTHPSPQLPGQMPKICHKTWKSDNASSLPTAWRVWRANHEMMLPDWRLILWTDDDNRRFLERHYDWFLPVYDAYPFTIQRVDVIRYFLLYHYGGLYLDMDIFLLKNLSAFLHLDAVLPLTFFGFSNDFMMAKPRHPFFRQLIYSLKDYAQRDFGHHYFTVMFSTGSFYLTYQYVLSQFKQLVAILPPPLYSIQGNHSLVWHVKGDSWHNNDDKQLLSNVGMLIVVFEIGVFLSVVCLTSCCFVKCARFMGRYMFVRLTKGR